MKHMTWAIVVVGLLLAGSTLPVEAAGGGGGFHGGGGGYSGGGRYHGGGGGWHGGGGGWGWHGGGVVIVGPGFWGPWWYGGGYPYYPYPYYSDPYYATPPVAVQQDPSVYIQQSQSQPQQPNYWYYCQNPQGYYPYVQQCSGGWMTVVPQPPSPGQQPSGTPRRDSSPW
jgi:hypothetical protein